MGVLLFLAEQNGFFLLSLPLLATILPARLFVHSPSIFRYRGTNGPGRADLHWSFLYSFFRLSRLPAFDLAACFRFFDQRINFPPSFCATTSCFFVRACLVFTPICVSDFRLPSGFCAFFFSRTLSRFTCLFLLVFCLFFFIAIGIPPSWELSDALPPPLDQPGFFSTAMRFFSPSPCGRLC